LSTRARVSGKRKISIIVAFADRADRIDRQIAQGFPPDFGANVAERARLQAGFHERRVDGRTRSLSEPSISPMGRRLLRYGGRHRARARRSSLERMRLDGQHDQVLRAGERRCLDRFDARFPRFRPANAA
jgi:hypothetical protein